jgi:hypothetical protein
MVFLSFPRNLITMYNIARSCYNLWKLNSEQKIYEVLERNLFIMQGLLDDDFI